MNHIKKQLLLILLLIGASFCYAEQVSFQIIQHNNSVEKVTEEASVVEDALIGSFFDFGYIVTNSEAALAKNYVEDDKLWQIGMNEAVTGGSDYFVQVVLEFTEEFDEAINKNVMILSKATYKINNTTTLDVLGSGAISSDLKINNPSDLAIISDSLIYEISKVLNA